MRIRERQEGIVCDQLVGLKMQHDASKHYESLFVECTCVGATKSALYSAMKSCLCHLMRPETRWERKMSEKFAREKIQWVGSEQAKFMKFFACSGTEPLQ